MNSWKYYSDTVRAIVWTQSLANHPAVHRARKFLEHAEQIEIEDPPDGVWEPPPELANAGTILVRPPTSRMFGRCPGTHGHLCCNYLTVDVYVGCTIGCSYCIMQSYLRNRTLVVQIDSGESLEYIRQVAALHPDQMIRVGTGEVGDSLLFDPLFDLSRGYIEALAKIPNVRFELKSKTDYVDHLLDIPDPGRAVIAFSVNPQSIVDTEEGYAARLDERLAAARRASDAGYGLAFHFDPMIAVPGWETAYAGVVEKLGRFRDRDVAWVSLGTLRFPPTLQPYLQDAGYAAHEFVRSRDGKMRYLQPIRSGMYRRMRALLEEALPTAAVYLCMESEAVWKNVYAGAPVTQKQSVRDVLRPVHIRDVVGVDR